MPAMVVPEGFARHSFRAMGTDALVVVPADDLQLASREVGTLFANWEQTLSRFRE